MGIRNFTPQQKLLDAVSATGIGNGAVNVEDFRHLVLSLNTSGSANGTIKFLGSIQDVEPDFTAAQSPTNAWDFVQVKDLEDGSSIDGDTGIALAGTDDNRLLEANVNGLKWFAARITTHSAGDWTVLLKIFNDQIS